MSHLIDTFGAFVDRQAPAHPVRARRLLIAAYEAKKWQMRLAPDRGLPPSKRELCLIMMQSILDCLRRPEHSAMVSLFVPCEPLTALGVHPYSVEGLSCYLTGAGAYRAFLDHTVEDGVPETLCSYHRVFLGAAGMHVMPAPRFVLHTNLACDANQLTFRNLAGRFHIPDFAVDVPFAHSEEAVRYVAEQLRKMVRFIEDCSGQKLPEEALRAAVGRSARTAKNYRRYLSLQNDHWLSGDVTSELYAAFMNHVLLGTPQVERFSQMCLEDVQNAPPRSGLNLLWLHTIPFWQQPVRQRLNFSDRVRIAACDMSYEGLVHMDASKPYESMAARMVYSGFNGSAEYRVKAALQAARTVGADGVVYFCHWGCKATLGAAQMVKQSLEAAGFPTLILDGDGCDPGNSSDGQVSTRLDAFLELLEARNS
ncbi:MAG: 2-hydroxyacyl-CoA dehydratase family protein [Intestinimonas sp.]|jgi:benzoyl-CoA reductase/2-hydroxyglutaryl-CoA dehydratase subunit BcrC/BadD/HgdB|nr:2-hydroxyacyl-CoA dehydratase family protein [Intestinimonas sp.]